MHNLDITQINDLSSFKKIRNEWEQLYKSDRHANLYNSWLWLYSLFSTSSFEWAVLAIKDVGSSSYIAFYPFKYENSGVIGIYPIRRIIYAGKPIAAYSGFLCSPEYESEAIQLLANYVQKKLKWDIFRMDWTKDPRLDIFLNSFPDTKFSVEVKNGLPQLCVTLPKDYQTYLKINVSKETRRKIRRRTRFIEREENYRITYSSKETIERDIDVICQQWYNRWHKEKETEWHRSALHKHFDNDLLRLSMIWDGDTPAAALACLVDPEKKVYNAYITSYNPDYSKIAPGIVLFSESIKQAIEQNYRFYDFTLGLDPYKLSFGPEQYEINDLMIKKKRFKTVMTERILKLAKKIIR